MKIAITGASGYVGNCISNCFRAHGHEVLSLSRRPCAAPWVSYALGDDPQLLPWKGVDVLVHAAYDFTPRSWPEILDGNVTKLDGRFLGIADNRNCKKQDEFEQVFHRQGGLRRNKV